MIELTLVLRIGIVLAALVAGFGFGTWLSHRLRK